MPTRLVPAIIAILVVTSVAFAPLVSAAPTQGFLSTRGTSIVDSSGRTVILRGVNYPGYDQAHPTLHSVADYATLSSGFGFNVVRLQISWANLEPSKGQFNPGLLWYDVDRDVAYAKENGLYIVLDMHQDSWAQKFGGDGAPGWAVDQYPSSDLGMREAVSDFWADPSMQNQLIMVWQNIARYYANEPTIAGYDLLNEPMIYTSIIPSLNASNVDAFYNRTVAAIRSVDPNHIIFLEPSNFMYTINTPSDSKIVWEPHFYPLSYYPKYYPENATALEADMAAEYQEFVLNAKTPMWIGEFGAFMTDSKDRGAWMQDALTLFSRYQIGWAWWAYTGQYELVPDQLYVPT